METGTILIVDDNKSVLASLELLLENEFSTVRTAANPNQITTLLTTTSIDIVILDMNFSAGINNGNEGLYWLKHIHEIRPALPVVMLTAYGDVELAVKALKNGATDFLLKPWDNRTLVQKIKEAYNNKSNRKSSSKSKNSIVGSGNPNKPEMLIGHSPAMLQLIKVVNKVARTDANILITGENGTGKEMLAREIHRLSHAILVLCQVSTWELSVNPFLRASFSVTSAELLRTLTKAVRENSKLPAAVRFLWMRLEIFPLHYKPNY